MSAVDLGGLEEGYTRPLYVSPTRNVHITAGYIARTRKQLSDGRAPIDGFSFT